jgi:RNA polymerase sigma-70 factor, ECF subfamily
VKTFEQIYAENYSRLHRLASRMVDDKESATDIVQDVFLVLFEKLNKHVEIAYINTWLYRVTFNKSVDFLNRKKKHATLDEVREAAIEDFSPDHLEKERFLQGALNQLQPTERALLVLYSEDFSYKEMAESTGIRFSSVGKTLARSLAKMEKILKQQGYELY